MALTEGKKLVKVALLLDSQTIDVKWENQIFRDGELISSIPHCKAYSAEQKDDFLTEVDGAAEYIRSINW